MPARAETAIGVDVGGTHLRAALIDRAGTLLERVIEPVCADREGFAVQLLHLIAKMRHETCQGVGIGIPGRVNAASGIILSTGYLDIAGLDLPGLVASRLGLQTRLENDATMALLAEAQARPERSDGVLSMVTIGTGIGGAILENGRPWQGGGLAGQFGHLVVDSDGPPCLCGRLGCVETFSSGTALGRLIDEAGLDLRTRAGDLLQQAEEGDARSAALLDRWTRPLQRALQTLISAIDPELVVIGGGLGGAMVQALERLPHDGGWFGLPVEPARLADDAGVIGAGLRCFREHSG